jgi:hypothetical protein
MTSCKNPTVDETVYLRVTASHSIDHVCVGSRTDLVSLIVGPKYIILIAVSKTMRANHAVIDPIFIHNHLANATAAFDALL